jgi:hypothetical protein
MEARRLVTVEKKKKKDEEKKRARKKILVRDALEKRRRAQVREALWLDASPNTEEDDDDDGERMEVCMGFSPEVGLWSAPASTGPSGGVARPTRGPAASLSGARLSVEPPPVPASVEEAGTVEEEVIPLPQEAVGVPTGA